MAKISFDFDGVLTTKKGVDILKKLTSENNDIYIITARRRSIEVLDFARDNNIELDHIYFTSGFDKWKTIQDLKIDVHYDNNQEQIDKINTFTNTSGRLFKN